MEDQARRRRCKRRIVRILYIRGQANLDELTEAVPGRLSREAVRGLLRELEECGRVKRTPCGRQCVYSPALPVPKPKQTAGVVWTPPGWSPSRG